MPAAPSWARPRRTGKTDVVSRLCNCSLTQDRFYNQLTSSASRGATWRLIGSQIVFSRINITTWFGSEENPFNSDAWDGYIANKNRTLKTL